MGDYVVSWKKLSDRIFRRTYSFRSRTPAGAVTATRLRVGREERLESTSSLRAKAQLYSDLYAEANLSSTYNDGDIGHSFVSQTWKCSPYGQVYPGDNWIPKNRLMVITSSPLAALAVYPLNKWAWSYFGVQPKSEAINLMGSSINDALWAQCPDRIRGSLGQDVVDVLDFGKSLDKLLSLQAKGVGLMTQLNRFSAKKKRQIDEVFRLIRRNPKEGRRIARRHLAGQYLTWIFQYLPWVDDLRTLLDAATVTYLRARGEVRKHATINLGKALTSVYSAASRSHPMARAFGIEGEFGPDVTSKPLGEFRLDSARHRVPRPPTEVTSRLTCSVVSSWTQNFEHGAAEPLYELNKQLGIVYPSLIWDLIPWSWLIDWFINVGKFIDRAWMNAYGEWNCSYAYATTKFAMTWRGLTYLSTARWHIHPSVWEGSYPSSQLSSSQWSILTALGLSHRK